MSATTSFASAVLALYLNATAHADLAEDDSTSPLTSFWVSLHTSDPGASGNQETGETTYTGYARFEVARTSAGWTVTSNSASNTAQIGPFGLCTDNPGSSITHFALGSDETGTGAIYLRGALTNAIAMTVGANPYIAADGATITVPTSL